MTQEQFDALVDADERRLMAASDAEAWAEEIRMLREQLREVESQEDALMVKRTEIEADLRVARGKLDALQARRVGDAR